MNKYAKNIAVLFILLLLITGCSYRNQSKITNFSVETKQIENRSYVLFRQETPYINFTLTRPSKDNKNIILAVPGTYTSPRNTVEGFVVLDGKIIQDRERQGWDGAALFKDGSITILQTENGRLLTKTKLREIADGGNSLIQAHLLVFENKAQHFKPQKLYQRRALVLMSDNKPAIIESKTALDLNDFTKDLVQLGIKDAVNLDMGSWSEGWYRDPATGDSITLGIPNETTKRQTNWIVFEQ